MRPTKVLLVVAAALALALAWVIRIGFPELGEVRVPPGQSVTQNGLTLTLEQLTVAESLPNSFAESNVPVPGAVYLVAEFSLSSDPEFNSGCVAYAVGAGRQWSSSYLSLPNGQQQDCLDTHSGTIIKVFEVPKRALPEIIGVQMGYSEYADPERTTLIAGHFLFFEGKAPLE
jgi:hypothetical protein